MEAVVSISGLSKTYASGQVALTGVDLEIRRGEIFALLGPNGAGKTTLINIICGIVNPTTGRVLADGHDVVREYRAARGKIGMLRIEQHDVGAGAGRERACAPAARALANSRRPVDSPSCKAMTLRSRCASRCAYSDRLCPRPQGLPRQPLRPLSAPAEAVRCVGARARGRTPRKAAQESRPRRASDPRRLGTCSNER